MRVAVLGGEARDLVNFRGHLIQEMAKRGHTVFAIAPGGTPEIERALAGLGGTYVPAVFNRTGTNPLSDLLSFVRLVKLLSSLDLDLLLAYEIKSVVYGVPAARLARIPRRFAMITGRGSALSGEAESTAARAVRGVLRVLMRRALGLASGVFFQNPDDLAFFREEGLCPGNCPHRIINGSGVDLGHFAPMPLPEGEVTFLFVGRLLRDKGIAEYVEAAKALAGEGLPLRCRILGPLDSNPRGIQEHQLEAWTREGGVEYLGSAKDVRPFLAESHALVLPSYCEGTPRSVLEAMSMGRAVVTTDAPGCRETVEDGRNGFLVPIRDAGALAGAMKRLVLETALIGRFGGEGRRIAEAKYDVRKVTADILDFMGVPPA